MHINVTNISKNFMNFGIIIRILDSLALLFGLFLEVNISYSPPDKLDNIKNT